MATIPEAFAIALECRRSGNLQEAEAICREILQAEPNHADALHILGVVAGQSGRNAVAVEYIHQAIRLKPNFAYAHFNLGTLFQAQGQTAEAAAQYREALDINPEIASASPLGDLLMDEDRPADALVHYRHALRLKPDYAAAHNNVAIALQSEGQLAEAVTHYQRAVSMRPGQAEWYCNLGNALKDQRKLTEALAQYRHAFRLDPSLSDARKSAALVSLLAGDYEQGWFEYEWRWRCKDYPPRNFAQPLWDGSSLSGQTILLHGKRGLGDRLQFIRYAPLVKGQGGTVIVESPPPLARLFANSPGVDKVVTAGSPLPAFDTHAPLMSLPRIFRTSLATIPADVPYLFADATLVEHWHGQFREMRGFKIGIAWHTGVWHSGRADRPRCVRLDQFAPLTRLEGVHLLSLQKGLGTEQIAEVADQFVVTDLESRLETFMNTAAIMKNLDLIITVDTSVAHCAGALGVPVWVLLPNAGCWRWLLHREDSPWYPTMRLFRQSAPGNWDEVFQRIVVEVKRL